MNAAQKIAAFLSALVAASLFTCAPVMAQSSSPSASQYEDCGLEADATACAQALDVADGAETITGNAGQGTAAVNEAMTGAEASVPPFVFPEDEGVASITRLPETGGVPVAALGSGVLLVLFGLAVRRIS